MELTRYELDNGMKVILHPNSSAPVVACNVWVGVGSADETPLEAGLAHVHEHMLFKGTERRGVGQLAQEVEAAGGHINAFTSFDQTCYYVVMSSRFFEAGLDILSDAIMHSSFDAEELERELEVIQEEIKRGKDNPSRMATQALFETAYVRHPYRLPVIGTKESVDSFERQNVVDFYHKHYVPSNMTVILAGDFDLEEARAKIAHYFGAFDAAQHVKVEREPEPRQAEVRAAIVTDKGQDVYMRLAFHVPDAAHDDLPALDLLSMILGQGEASTLHRSVQREQELVNMIYSAVYPLRDSGLFFVAADYQMREEGQEHGPMSHEEVLEATCREIFATRAAAFDDADIARARTLLESQAVYSKQTVEGLAEKFGYYAMLTGDPQFEDQYYERLARVDADELRAVAAKYLVPGNATVIVSHPEGAVSVAEDALEEILRRVYDETATPREAVASGALVIEPPAPTAAERVVEVDADGFAYVEIPGGPRLIIQENHAVELFSVRALTFGGLRLESAGSNGINSLATELVTRGTPGLDAAAFSYVTESMASSISGISGRNTFGVSASGLSRYWEPCVELMASCMFEATVPDDEFDREVRLHLQELKSRQDQLGVINFEAFAREFFGGHPYARPIYGTHASISGLTPQDIRDYYAQVFVPERMTMAVVGDVDASRVVARFESLFSGREATGPVSAATFEAPAPRTSPVLVTSDLDKNQAHVIVGFRAPTVSEPERYALEVLQSVLSGQGGRLFLELRDRQSLAYSVYASTILGLEASAFMVNIGTSPEKIEQAVQGIFGEVQKLREGGVRAEEVEEAKRYLIGNHDIGLQRNGSRAMSIALDELYGMGYRRSFAYAQDLESVTRDSIQEVIERYLNPKTAVVAVTKPGDVGVDAEALLSKWS